MDSSPNNSYFDDPGSIWCYLPLGPEAPQRLEMDPEFYDYSTAPWWPAFDADDTVHASYAYIDALGTNQHVVTFTKCVTREGKMAGVAATDVLVSRLQRIRPTPAAPAAKHVHRRPERRRYRHQHGQPRRWNPLPIPSG
ncbi:hypothetical protein [Arthrobacter sp. NA-172]|uniref:PDC sensor domain-containing protein n=1 Tax=Arthrobacter sp. NA-172 TaxID=3367524 RepID=UPI0037545D16